MIPDTLSQRADPTGSDFEISDCHHMPEYTFSTLSPHDFELLSRDLLQKEWGKNLESFKSGRDQGIDLRYSKPRRNTKWIVQCKHYRQSGFSSLKNALKTSELPKIAKLKPTRYVVTTSVQLSLPQKNELALALAPHCRGPADILGSEDLNNLLGKHRDVEQQHFKLWLPSSEVLHRLLHNGVFTQSALEVDDIKRHLSLFVPTDAVQRGLEMLDNHGFCMLTGIPGIGKTTTARILVAHHVHKEWQGICLSSCTTEAFDAFRPDEKQVFFFDDFLGQTSLQEKLLKNEDKQLQQLIHACQKNPGTKRLILTTREHLFEQARQQHEVLARSGITIAACTVELRDYTKRIRAEILVNHLYFYGVTPEVCSEFVASGAARTTLQHEHYNPRIVESMCKMQHYAAVDSSQFGNRFIELLDDPDEIWKHAYRDQLSENARQLLLVFSLLGNNTMVDILKVEYRQLVEQTGAGLIGFEERFRRSLDELEGCFLTVHRNPTTPFISYHNPSIKDFTDRVLSEETYLLTVAVNHFRYNVSAANAARLLLAKTEGDISGAEIAAAVKRVDYHTPIRAHQHSALAFASSPPDKLQALRNWISITTERCDTETIRELIKIAEIQLRGADPTSHPTEAFVALYNECQIAASSVSANFALSVPTLVKRLVDHARTPDEFIALNELLCEGPKGDELRELVLEAFPGQMKEWLEWEVDHANSSQQIDDAIGTVIDASESVGLSENELDLDHAYGRFESLSAQEDAESEMWEDDLRTERDVDAEDDREIDDILDSLRS